MAEGTHGLNTTPMQTMIDTEAADMSVASSLDLLSTSQTLIETLRKEGVNSNEIADLKFQLEQRAALRYLPCPNRAPYIFFVDATNRARIVQGCCNSWTCSRCGHIRACTEYGRIVAGAKKLSEEGQNLYFLTLTCRGRDMALDDAEKGYMQWCNRLLTNARKCAKRDGWEWYYACVTERQERGHPHSHIMVSFCPSDAIGYTTGADLPNGIQARHDGLYSQWLVDACVSAGLGPMTDLSAINSVVGVAVYAAKYFFKDAMSTRWPKGWRRVRYSQSWPKLPAYPSSLAFPLVRIADWKRMEDLGRMVYADCEATLNAAYARLITCVVLTPEKI